MLEANWTAGKYIQSAGRIQRMSDFDNLAKLIKRAAKIREESWDPKGYGKYKLNLDEACEKAAKELNLEDQHKSLANLMLFSFWNDALDWADRQLYPIQMAYVAACYGCANGLNFGDFGHDLESASDLAKDFCKSAEGVRKSLYGFGND